MEGFIIIADCTDYYGLHGLEDTDFTDFSG